MIDFIVSALATPGPAWIGIGLGIVVAGLAWVFLPETMDRASFAGWSIAIGFAIGMLLAAIPDKGKNDDT